MTATNDYNLLRPIAREHTKLIKLTHKYINTKGRSDGDKYIRISKMFVEIEKLKSQFGYLKRYREVYVAMVDLDDDLCDILGQVDVLPDRQCEILRKRANNMFTNLFED